MREDIKLQGLVKERKEQKTNTQTLFFDLTNVRQSQLPAF